jgi:hypothetical protein
MPHPHRETFQNISRIYEGPLERVYEQIEIEKKRLQDLGYVSFSLELQMNSDWAEDGDQLVLMGSRPETDAEYEKRVREWEIRSERAKASWRKLKSPTNG